MADLSIFLLLLIIICGFFILLMFGKIPKIPAKPVKSFTSGYRWENQQKRKTLKVQLCFRDRNIYVYNSFLECRRFTVSIEVLQSYSLLCEKIVSVFPVLKDKSFTISWRDHEGAYILMSTDEELAEAIFHNQKAACINLRISASSKTVPPSGVLHPGVYCINCNDEIQGYRYKCLECDSPLDVNICNSCHALDSHPDHDMLKMSSPIKHPQHLLFLGWYEMCNILFGHKGKKGRKCKENKSFYSTARNATNSKQVSKFVKNAITADKKKNAKFVQSIAEAIAFVLDTLDCEADKEHSVKRAETCDDKSRTEEPTIKEEVKKLKDLEMLSVNSADKKQSKNGNTIATGEKTTVEVKNVIDSTVCGERRKEKNLSPCSSRSSNSGSSLCGNDDWTVVNTESAVFDVIASNEKAEATAKHSPGQSVKVNFVPPQAQNTQASKQKNATNGDELAPTESQIAKALETMNSMGFNNDGGWLLSLVEAKKGSIEDVMDSLYPKPLYR